jgi:hypothetical protein
VNLLPDRHAQFVIIQWITCVVPKLANLLMHSKTLRKVCTCQKLNLSFLLLEYCKIRECYAVANAFTIRNMYSLFFYMKSNSRKIKTGSILTNFFAEPTVLLVPITSRDKSTMDRCSVYLTPQGLPKYIYLSPPLIFDGFRYKEE